MKPDEKKKLLLNMRKAKLEYPVGLEKFMPVDEEAINYLKDDYGDTVDQNIKKYFEEQVMIKERMKEAYEQINKDGNQYQENCKKLIEYIKGLSV